MSQNLTPEGSAAAPRRPTEAVASRRSILIATGIALVVAALILVTTVLPAEYGIDPLGTGKALGLTALAQVRPGVLAIQPAAFRQDEMVFVLAPFESVEYKYRLELDASMVYSWAATGTVSYDLHSEPEDAPEGYAESFEKSDSTAGHGTYTAPFSGIHGWFWENRGRREVTVTLTTAGFYSGALEFRGGHIFEHETSPLTADQESDPASADPASAEPASAEPSVTPANPPQPRDTSTTDPA
jgi:hypothetical protein